MGWFSVKPRTDVSRSGRADSAGRAGFVTIGDGEDAEPDAGNVAQMGGGARAEAGRRFVVRMTGDAAWRVEPATGYAE